MHLPSPRRPLTAAAILIFVTAAAQAGQLKVTDYGKAGAWTLRKAMAGGTVKVCDALKMTGSEQGLRYEYTLDTSALAFSGLGSAADKRPLKVKIWFDDDRAAARVAAMTLESDATGYEWRTYRSSNSEVDGPWDLFANASTIHFTYTVKGVGTHEESFPLAGTNKAFKTTIACVGDAKPPAPAAATETPQSKPVACELTVGGKTYIKGRCQYRPEAGGSFQIDGGDYFAQVDITGKDVGEAHWNEDPRATHAQSRLGPVTRTGACWTGPRVKICAQALPAAATAAALASQPNGMMLWPDFASTACIGVEGPLAPGATPVLHNCKLPADLIFVAAPDGTLSIDKHPDLCLDLEAPGMSKPPQLVLLACGAEGKGGGKIWRWQGRGAEPGIVKSVDGLCWTIPQAKADPDKRFPWPVAPRPCGKGGDAVKLSMSKN